jgi:hypothetical protein
MAGPYYNKGLKFTVAADANLASLAVAVDLDMRTGSPVDETRWLDGANGASGAYPGDLSGFLATNNDDTNRAGGSMRMLTLNLGAVTTAPVTITLSSGASGTGDDTPDGTPISKIIGIVGQSGASSVTKTDDLELTAAVATAGTVTILVV